jgi:hypothetical protein
VIEIFYYSEWNPKLNPKASARQRRCASKKHLCMNQCNSVCLPRSIKSIQKAQEEADEAGNFSQNEKGGVLPGKSFGKKKGSGGSGYKRID